jgi:hypothetical protein
LGTIVFNTIPLTVYKRPPYHTLPTLESIEESLRRPLPEGTLQYDRSDSGGVLLPDGTWRVWVVQNGNLHVALPDGVELITPAEQQGLVIGTLLLGEDAAMVTVRAPRAALHDATQVHAPRDLERIANLTHLASRALVILQTAKEQILRGCPMAWRVSVDLGKRKAGIAVWDDGILVHAQTIHVASQGEWEPVMMSTAILAGIRKVVDTAHFTITMEWPIVYGNALANADNVNDLQEVGRLLGVGIPTKRVSPFQWKGNVPKEITRARTRAVLSEAEVAQLPAETEHDAWDAVGIGLFAEGRTRRGIVPA